MDNEFGRTIVQKSNEKILKNRVKEPKYFHKIKKRNTIRFKNLWGYNYVRKQFLIRTKSDPLCVKLIKFSQNFIGQFYTHSYKKIYNLISKSNYTHGQCSLERFILGEDNAYLPFNDKLWRNRFLLGITHMIYQLKCKIIPFDGKSYFGFTDDLNRRIEEHTIEALAPRGFREEGHMHISLTKLHKAIREAFKLNSKYSRFFSEGGTFEDIYYDLINKKGTREYNIKMYYIREDVIKSCFDIFKIEMTRGIKFARDRERFYTRSYENDDGTFGTVKNGLNERYGGGGRGISGIFYKLPWLDVAGMLSLGLSYVSITEIIKKLYKELEHIDVREVSRQIKNMWGNQQAVYLKFMLPILEKLLKYDSNIAKKEILDLFNWSNNKFDRYFGSIKKLKEMIEKYGYLDAKMVQLHIKSKKQQESLLGISNYKLKTLMRGVDIEQYKKWIIEGKSGNLISKKIGTSRKMVYYIYQQISHLLVGSKCLSFENIQKILRRDVAIKSLRRGMNPRNIIGEKFKLKSYKKMTWNEVHEFYERLFEENGVKKLNYQQIIDKYSQKF